MNYYVAEGTTQRGPFSMDELSRVGLTPQTLVWTEGMAEWQPAHTVEALRPLLSPPQAGQPSAGPQGGAQPLPVAYAGPQPVGYAPPYAPPDSNKIAAGVCGILLGGFGVHKFILGLTSGAVTMLCVTLAGLVFGGACACAFPPLFLLIFAPTIMHVIGLIEGIIYLSRSDQEFYQLYVVQKRQWF